MLFKPGGRDKGSHISLLEIIMHSETLMKQMTLVDCIQKINNRKIKDLSLQLLLLEMC